MNASQDNGDDTGRQRCEKGVLLLGEQFLGGLHHILGVCGVVELWLIGSDLAGAAALGPSLGSKTDHRNLSACCRNTSNPGNDPTAKN